VMLAHAIEDSDFANLDAADFIAEWKWDGIRVQAVSGQDANGNVVYSGSGQTTAGNNNFNWNGVDNSGNQLPDGSYTLAVKASAGGSTVTTSVTAVGTVSEVNMINGTPQLLIGSMEVPLTSISSVHN